MDKSLSQITFEFFGAQQQETTDGVPEQPVLPRREQQEVTKPVAEQPLLPPKGPVKNTRGRKSLKDIELEAEQVEVPEDEVLFQKQYYSIGEVASMFKVNTSLNRYWENEFDILEPRKNRKGDRFFKPSDVKNLQ